MQSSLKVLCVVAFLMVSRFVAEIDYNEMAFLPMSLSLYNSQWLANDWFLSQTSLINLPAPFFTGMLIDWFGIYPVVWMGRLASYVLFAVAWVRLLRVTETDFSVGTVGLLMYLLYFPEGMHAGEWIMGGLEGKVFAYVFALFSLAYLLEEKWRRAFLFAGLSLSMHVLIGGYHLVCVAVLIAFKWINKQINPRMLVAPGKWLLLGGVFGFLSLFSYFLSGPSQDAELASQILVHARNPFHNLPKLYWSAYLFPILFSIANVLTIFFSRKPRFNLMALYALSTSGIAFLGVLMYLTGYTGLLRFYLFRYADSMQPLLTLLVFAAMVSPLLNRLTHQLKSPQQVLRIARGALIAISAVVLLLTHGNLRSFSGPDVNERSSKDYAMLQYVNAHTPKDAVFIAPIDMESFYLFAERSLFVFWKGTPVDAEGILEWYKRVSLQSGGVDLLAPFIDPRMEVIKGYAALGEEGFLRIRKEYPEVTHAIFPISKTLEFKLLHETEKYRLYELP